jgi:hypothetical protein
MDFRYAIIFYSQSGRPSYTSLAGPADSMVRGAWLPVVACAMSWRFGIAHNVDTHPLFPLRNLQHTRFAQLSLHSRHVDEVKFENVMPDFKVKFCRYGDKLIQPISIYVGPTEVGCGGMGGGWECRISNAEFRFSQLMYHEDVADEDDEGSADEEKEEPDRRQRRAMTTPHVLELVCDVYCPVECAGPRSWRVTQMVAPVHSRGTSGMVSATREDESTFRLPPPPPFPFPHPHTILCASSRPCRRDPPVNPRSSRDCPS